MVHNGKPTKRRVSVSVLDPQVTQSTVTKTYARSLFRDLKVAFTITVERVRQIIDLHAWEKLDKGYTSFTDAWLGEVGSADMDRAVAATVAAQMILEGHEYEARVIGAD